MEIKLSGLDHLPARWELYQTTRAINCAKTDSVPVQDGTARFNLPGESIFTLVGKL